MNIPRLKQYSAFLALLWAVMLCTGASAQNFPTNAPLGLRRLADSPDVQSAAIRKDAFDIVDLRRAETRTAKLQKKTGIDYLDIGSEAVWEYSLRKQRDGANYITFTINASIGTKVSIAGAEVSVEQSTRDAGYAAIRTGSGKGRTHEHEVPLLLFSGRQLAPLDIVTVKIDRKTRLWSLWFRDTLVAEDVPVSENNLNRIRVTAGRGGAWICALVCSDENPLFEDDNDNAVPDHFELKSIGTILPASAAEQSLSILRAAWLDEKRLAPSEFLLTTPLPDAFPEYCSPEGTPVHGMQNGLKFGAPKK